MKSIFRIICLTLLSFNAFADYSSFEVDNKLTHKKTKVKLISGKKDSNRFYQGNISKVFNTNIDKVLPSILNFTEKCNNELAQRRKWNDKKTECPYHNGNLIESKVYKIEKEYKKEENEIDRFLVARRIYNRQNFSHVDLIQVFETKNSSGNKIIKIKQQMLKDKDVKKYIKPPVEMDSAFQVAKAEFTITSIDPKSTIVSYYYSSETDHWLLNKSVSVGQVFDSMGLSIGLLIDSIDQGIKR